MKRIIIIRSLRVALVLAILCASLYLTCYRHYAFVILILLSLFFLEVSDSMLAWRLKRIESPQMRTSFIYVYLVATLAGVISAICAVISTVRPGMEDILIGLFATDTNALKSIFGLMVKTPFNLFWLMYSMLVVLFSFRYYIIVVRVMTMFLDTDEEY